MPFDAELIDSGAMPVEETEVFGPHWREIAGTVRTRGTPWWRVAVPRSASQGAP